MSDDRRIALGFARGCIAVCGKKSEASAPEGALLWKGLAVSLKRYPDTNPDMNLSRCEN